MEALDYSDSTVFLDDSSREDGTKEPLYGEDAPENFAEDIKREAEELDCPTCVLEKSFNPSNIFYLEESQDSNWTSHSLLIEEWEGCIKMVLEDSFIAHLYKSRTDRTEIIEGEFGFDSVPSDEQHLIKEGMVFYWVIGKEIKKSGTIKYTDCLIMRRMPSWKNFDAETPSAIADNFFDVD